MAYQPIQMPESQGLGIADAILAARHEQRQKEQDRWAQIREQGAQDLQRQQLQQATAHQQFEDRRQLTADVDTVRLQIQSLHDKGLGHQAQEFAKLHGLTFQAQPVTEAAPVAPQLPQEPAAPPEAPLQGPVIPGAQDQNSQLIQGERDAVAAYPAQMEEHGHQMMDVFPQQQAAYEQQAAAHDQRMANPIVNYSGPQGSFSVDPMEARQAQLAENARRADMFRQTFAAEPAMASHAGEFAARVGLGEPTAQVFGDYRAQTQAEAKARADAEKEAAKAAEELRTHPSVEKQDEWHRMMAAATARREAGAGAGREDAAGARAGAMLERAVNDADKMVDWKGLVSIDNSMRGLMANLGSEANPLQHKDAQIQLARYFRQAQPTEGEMHMLYSKLGGTMDKWDQWIAGLENGDLSATQLRYLQESANTAHHEFEERKGRTFKALATKLGPGSEYEMLGNQVDREIQARAAVVGAEIPRLYDVQPGQGVKLLGSKAAKGGAPKAAIAPEDKQAIEWAHANPRDPRAAQILKLHGM